MKKILFLFLTGIVCASCTQTEKSFLESNDTGEVESMTMHPDGGDDVICKIVVD